MIFLTTLQRFKQLLEIPKGKQTSIPYESEDHKGAQLLTNVNKTYHLTSQLSKNF